MKRNCISETKKAARVALCFVFANLINGWLNRRQQDSHICLCILSGAICCFDGRIWRKSGPAQICIWKEGNILIAFSGDCRYSSLILYQNLANGSFFMFRCNVESEVNNNKLSYSYIKILWLVFPFEWIFFTNACFCNCVHRTFGKSWSCWAMQIFQMWTHFII